MSSPPPPAHHSLDVFCSDHRPAAQPAGSVSSLYSSCSFFCHHHCYHCLSQRVHHRSICSVSLNTCSGSLSPQLGYKPLWNFELFHIFLLLLLYIGEPKQRRSNAKSMFHFIVLLQLHYTLFHRKYVLLSHKGNGPLFHKKDVSQSW